MPIQPNSLKDFPERLYQAQINLIRRERKKRLQTYHAAQTILIKKIVQFRKASKRSQEMNFVDEDWYSELKAKEQSLHKRVVECVQAIRKLETKIASLHGQTRTPYRTPRKPETRSRKR